MTPLVPPDLGQAVDGVFDEMVDTRRQIHAHPELSFAEFETTAIIDARLAELGFSLLARPTETGGIFVMDGARPGRTAVMRADIDALPVHEEVALPFRSSVDGLMHACGHDIHVASLLGAARVLSQARESLAGRFVLVFQPAEEALGGAKAMIEGGAMEVLAGGRMVGFHVASLLPAGLASYRSGTLMAEANAIHFALRGTGGHGAVPSAKGDVIRTTGLLLAELAGVVDGLHFEGTDCVCSAGLIRAGTANNVVPTHSSISGTLRTFTTEQLAEAKGRLDDVCRRLGEQHGVSISITYPQRCPAVINDHHTTSLIETELRHAIGDDCVFEMPPVAPSDDISEFLNRMPGCYYFIGGAMSDGSSGMHHSPTFALDEACLKVGARTMVGAAMALAQPEE